MIVCLRVMPPPCFGLRMVAASRRITMTWCCCRIWFIFLGRRCEHQWLLLREVRFETRFFVMKPKKPKVNHGLGFAAAAVVKAVAIAARGRTNFILWIWLILLFVDWYWIAIGWFSKVLFREKISWEGENKIFWSTSDLTIKSFGCFLS